MINDAVESACFLQPEAFKTIKKMNNYSKLINLTQRKSRVKNTPVKQKELKVFRKIQKLNI